MNNPDNYFKGLTALIKSAFPKKCRLCGRIYQTADDFLIKTDNMPNDRSSLKEAIEEDGTAIVEVFRNCRCGSTLMDEFNSRRDYSDTGLKNRLEFNNFLIILQNQHIPLEIARSEVRKLLQGKKSDMLDYLLKNQHNKDSYD
ncbi:MAG: oxidoreductase [Methylococcaceae bacterium]|nr:oxidoreductase [Methylococcaceae bacterium]